MEGMRHIEPVPSSGDALVRVGRRRADEKRGLENQFVLAEGEGISSFHAEMRCSGGKLFLKDLKSTNGTFVRNKPVIGEVPVDSGEVFLLSTTPVRAELVAEPRTEISGPESSAHDDAASPLRRMVELAREAARRRGEGFVDSRHLADAVLRSGDALVDKGFARARQTREEAAAALWQGGLFRGPAAWLQRFLSTPVESRKGPGTAPLSPRARQLLSTAEGKLAAYPAGEAETLAPVALLSALMASADAPVGGWLLESGVRAETPAPPRRSAARKTVTSTAVPARSARPLRAEEETVAETRLRREASAARAAARGAEEPPAPAARQPEAEALPQRPQEPSFATTGDVALDQRARAIALELEEAATLYRFSTVEDRRAVMKDLVNRSLAAIAPENRSRILSQIRVQFPVVGAPPPAETDEVPRLLHRIQELEQSLAKLKSEKAQAAEVSTQRASGAVPWSTLLSERAPEQAGGEGPDLPALHALVAFARHMEKFLLGLVQGVTMPGDATMSFRLPGHRYTLEGLLSALQQGKPVDPTSLSEYLRELERWQVAILAAHHASARVWFEKFWKRASPAAIEASTAKGGAWKLLGEAAEWWSRYKETVKGLTPDVAQDQLLQTTFRMAKEEFDKLSKRRQS
jgi:hypothetical protein